MEQERRSAWALPGDLPLVMRFVITPEPDKRSIEEEAYRPLREQATGE